MPRQTVIAALPLASTRILSSPMLILASGAREPSHFDAALADGVAIDQDVRLAITARSRRTGEAVGCGRRRGDARQADALTLASGA
jgi:hypothetical protein